MRIGLDFDNTIVRYDRLFHRAAVDQGVIPPTIPVSKVAVRDYLRSIDQEEHWTRLQGVVYGARMGEADAFSGVRDFITWATAQGITLYIISHRTRHPALGPQYDLHGAARQWIAASLHGETGPLIPANQIFFEVTKAEKLARIAACQCDLFVDDLPEILQAPAFPTSVQRLLFDPDAHHPGLPDILPMAGWSAIQTYVKSQCCP